MSLYLCLAAFLVCFIASRRSLVTGLTTLIAIGYAYGVVRANIPEASSHFIFDAGVLGLYSVQLFRRLSPSEEYRTQRVKPWLEMLIAWPLVLLLIPNQDLLIRLVGLRGNIFLLPFIIIGARLEDTEKNDLAAHLAVLNLCVFALAAVQFFIGIEGFFPRNEVTRLIYLSKDVVGNSAYRIPASFSGSHAYAGSMVMTLPLLLGALQQKTKSSLIKVMLITSVIASLLGVLMAASRLHFIGATLIVITAVFSMKSRLSHFLGWILILAGIAWLVSGEQRLQRFTQLQNTDLVSERIVGSVNMGFLELAAKYPFGNGLGGGGTSIPYFLRDRIEQPIGMENEYARIMLEQGLLGLALWVAFIVWVLTRPGLPRSDPWFIGRRLAWVTTAGYFAIALIGTGLLTSIPQTCLLLLSVGWVAARQGERVPSEETTLSRGLARYLPLRTRSVNNIN